MKDNLLNQVIFKIMNELPYGNDFKDSNYIGDKNKDNLKFWDNAKKASDKITRYNDFKNFLSKRFKNKFTLNNIENKKQETAKKNIKKIFKSNQLPDDINDLFSDDLEFRYTNQKNSDNIGSLLNKFTKSGFNNLEKSIQNNVSELNKYREVTTSEVVTMANSLVSELINSLTIDTSKIEQLLGKIKVDSLMEEDIAEIDLDDLDDLEFDEFDDIDDSIEPESKSLSLDFDLIYSEKYLYKNILAFLFKTLKIKKRDAYGFNYILQALVLAKIINNNDIYNRFVEIKQGRVLASSIGNYLGWMIRFKNLNLFGKSYSNVSNTFEIVDENQVIDLIKIVANSIIDSKKLWNNHSKDNSNKVDLESHFKKNR